MIFSPPNKSSGVTFVELLIVVVIVGIIASFAVPQYGGLIKKQSLLSESRRMTSLLKLARSEARARGAHIMISRANNTDWSGTLTVYENADLDDGEAFDATNDEVIKVSESAGRALVADASFDTQYLRFNPRGWVGGGAQISLALCASATDKKSGRLITVNRVGKITEGPIDDESCTQ